MRGRLFPCLVLCLLVAPSVQPRLHSPPLDPEHNPAFIAVSDDGSPLPDDATMIELAQHNPIAFVENCLRRYGREVKGYTALLRKHERIKKQLLAPELVAVSFRERPHSVLLKWVDGARLAGTVLYVKGERNDQLLVRPAVRLFRSVEFERDPYGDEAGQNGRYRIPEFGIRYGMERTLAAWMAARKRNALHVAYLGTRSVPELDNRVCHVLHRTGYEGPEDDGIADFVTYCDAETWLQIGSVLRGEQDQLIASYFFRELQLNPAFPPERFTSQGMRD